MATSIAVGARPCVIRPQSPELKVHAERAAKLKRIRSLALKKSKDDPAAKRATDLLTKETERHEKRMSELHGKTTPSAAPASTAPAQEKTE